MLWKQVKSRLCGYGGGRIAVRNPSIKPSREDIMKESDITKAILRYLKKVPECFCWKEHGGMYGTAGIPDVICCYKGHFVGFEVKTDKGQPTELQKATIEKIQNSGGTAVVVRSVDEVREVILSLQ